MKISFENPDKVNGLMTISVEEEDYKENVEKKLKEYRKKANIPGFRPGMVPMGLIKRQFGATVKMDVINNLLGENLQKYIVDNNIQMLGKPMGNEEQEPVDIEKGLPPYEFKFDIAVAPELNVTLTADDQIEYFDIEVDDQLVDNQVNMYASRAGHYNDKVETFDATKNDLLSGDLRELDSEGNSLEGGIVVDSASIMPQYFKGDEQKTLFENAKVGDIITFNPSKAYTGNDAEVASLLKIDKANVAEHAGDFSYQITKISRYENAEINKELFDSAFGKDANIETEEQFRENIKKELSVQLEQNSDFAFLKSVRTYCEQKAGEVVFPEAILKRIMLDNNKDKGEDYVENNFEQSIKELEWHLIREKLAQANGVKVEEADIKAAARDYARMQFAQYGMSNVPDDTLDSYAAEMLKKYETVEAMSERVIDKKLTDALKSVVKLDRKSISLDDFNKKMEA